jgi:hypothetical protein
MASGRYLNQRASKHFREKSAIMYVSPFTVRHWKNSSTVAEMLGYSRKSENTGKENIKQAHFRCTAEAIRNEARSPTQEFDNFHSIELALIACARRVGEVEAIGDVQHELGDRRDQYQHRDGHHHRNHELAIEVERRDAMSSGNKSEID